MMNAHFFDSMGDPILRHVDMEWVGMVVAKKKQKVGQHQQVIFPAKITTSWNNTEASTTVRWVSHPETDMKNQGFNGGEPDWILDRIDWWESGMWKRRHGRSGLEGDPQFPKKTFLVVRTLNGSWAKLRIPKLTDFYDH